mmetsp:Transcript_17565/g.28859  ORF Transcript_17565/g.28859 Transcript_17565/m.28859 type:complete len:186 (-) Transcript_17565:326-883(-)
MHRRLLSPAFSNYIDPLIGTINDYSAKFIQYCDIVASTHEPVLLLHLLSKLTLDVIGKVAFSTEFGCLEEKKTELEWASRYIFERRVGLSLFIPELLYLFPSKGNRDTLRARRILEQAVTDVIEERKRAKATVQKKNEAEAQTAPLFIDLLLNTSDNETGSALADDEPQLLMWWPGFFFRFVYAN